MNELARRAVACKGWRWMHGQPTDEFLIIEDNHDGDGLVTAVRISHNAVWDDLDPSSYPPEVSYGAGLGCLIQLVREAWDDPTAIVFPDRRIRDDHGKPKVRWFRMIDSAHQSEAVAWHCPADSEVEALVMALEAAP